jgi:hypothetical protein
MKERLISAQANLLVKLSVSGRSHNKGRSRSKAFIAAQANLLCKLSDSGRSQNEARTRQAIRGIRDMFRKDGLL